MKDMSYFSFGGGGGDEKKSINPQTKPVKSCLDNKTLVSIRFHMRKNLLITRNPEQTC